MPVLKKTSRSKKTSRPTKEVLKRSQSLKTKRWVGKVVIFSVIVIILFSVIIYILYLPALSVRSIFVQGNDILESTELIESVERTLAGKYWYILPRQSIFIYPEQTVIANLLSQFPRLSAVLIGSGDWDSLVVDVKERDSDSIWCRDSEFPHNVLGQEIVIEVASSSIDNMTQTVSTTPTEQFRDCYFADDAGFIFAVAPYFSNSVFVELSGFLSEDPIGQTPLADSSYTIVSHFAKNLAKIYNKTENSKYRLIRVRIIDKDNYEAIVADTSKETNYDWKIFFDNDESAEELTNNLYTVLTSESFKEEMLNNKNNLASIDLRYGKKVFYKFK